MAKMSENEVLKARMDALETLALGFMTLLCSLSEQDCKRQLEIDIERLAPGRGQLDPS